MIHIFYLFVDIVLAYLLDLLIGDPYWAPHPVRFIGWLITHAERILRKITGTCQREETKKIRALKERTAGVILAVTVSGITFLLVWGVLQIAQKISPILFHAVNIYFLYSSLAARCLGDEAFKVYKILGKGDLVGARRQLSMLVGRQTEGLSEKEIIRGAVETTAENTVDGVLSPLFYIVMGSVFWMGAPLVYAFKAVNTLDSMVGYANDQYIYFGWASAKADDVLNYIPARLSGLIIPLAALLCGKSFSGSFQIMVRDRKNHKSPNCAYPEAAFAGALGIRLGGPNIYFGKVLEKPTIGDPAKELEREDIADAVHLMYISALLTLAVILIPTVILIRYA